MNDRALLADARIGVVSAYQDGKRVRDTYTIYELFARIDVQTRLQFSNLSGSSAHD